MTRQLDAPTIYLALALLRETYRKALAGKSTRRRRERSSADTIAKHVVDYLRRNWEFHRAGKPADDANLIEHLAEVVWNVPPSLAEDHCAIDGSKRDAARWVFAEAIFNALRDEFEPVRPRAL
ncbi:hypothetical protein [Sinorhizobium medicae]|uniref:hypothetical protein n=1 Tax=Sinorhizobium medicae TaxID=110321 RepID=UPI00041A60BE|nr:hypothetical protein [Sinorhizobium medicae]RVQ76103.1 hypothetical protein CN244_06230 [Sinorhizobium medicae]